MRRVAFGMALVSVTVGAAIAASQSSDLVVHEWGTFLVMQGSDGITLDGMYHEEHALPEFVHSRSKDQLRIPAALVKGETPVIYFYTNRAQRVTARVDFPGGIWTQWYPQAAWVGPQLSRTHTPLEPRGGRITWIADVIPDDGRPVPGYPEASQGALWNFAREVDAAWVQTRDETRGKRPEADRFLFYRGLGKADLPVRMTTAGNGTLTWTDRSLSGARHIFVMRVENGKGAFRYVPELPAQKPVADLIPAMAEARPLAEFTTRVADDLAKRLVESGLYEKEARAMVNTWRTSYFHNDGIRALFIMPQQWTDRYIPLRIEPRPSQTVRVMVGRLELLTPERERRAESAVRDLASPNSAARNRAFELLREQGRYVEPIVRRVLGTTEDAKVRALCKRLLLTDFVTELRAAIHSAKDGGRLNDKPLHLRAQLATLLRDSGLDSEAKREAEAVLTELRRTPEPPMDQSQSRHYFRAYARAVEGSGDDQAATHAYARFIRFGAHVKRCGGCHEAEGPKTMAWFRDWYAGRRFAELARRSGQEEQLVAENEQRISQEPGDITARMLLAYLYEGRGERSRADAMWARVEGR